MIGAIIVAIQILLWLLGINQEIIEQTNLVLGLLFTGLQTLGIGLLGQLIANQHRMTRDAIEIHLHRNYDQRREESNAN